MAQLIQIRQRIKTIETIQKITYAMRLISMSSHSRLRNNYETLKKFVTTAFHMCAPLYKNFPPSSFSRTHSNAPTKQLIIAVGSQKGLCGNFNTSLMHVLENHLQGYNTNKPSLILIGKQLADILQSKYDLYTIKSYTSFTDQTYNLIAQSLLDNIQENNWRSVTVVSNYPTSFFVQKPTITNLIPLDDALYYDDGLQGQEYTWYLEPQLLARDFLPFLIKIYLEKLLFESLLAEQAARFLSMDSATRNADKLLQKMHLDYNKLRQSVITREVVELSSTF